MLIILASSSGCLSDHKYRYNYSRLEDIAQKLQEIYTQMKDSEEYLIDINKIESARMKILSDLEELEYEIDALPETEQEPKNKNDEEAKIFNEKLFNPRDLKNKIIDLYNLLYAATVSRDLTYYRTVIQDEAIEARLDNIIARAKEKGTYIPLPKEYQHLPVPATHEEADITIEEDE